MDYFYQYSFRVLAIFDHVLQICFLKRWNYLSKASLRIALLSNHKSCENIEHSELLMRTNHQLASTLFAALSLMSVIPKVLTAVEQKQEVDMVLANLKGYCKQIEAYRSSDFTVCVLFILEVLEGSIFPAVSYQRWQNAAVSSLWKFGNQHNM